MASWYQVEKLMPDVFPILQTLDTEFPKENYFIDVKVHKLMPNQFPCIPNWHSDFTPRDAKGCRVKDKLSKDKMYIWISNPPLAEFRGGKKLRSGEWASFTQSDIHRGTASETHIWRGFIRVIPKWFKHPNTKTCNNVNNLRIHSQVYLDSNSFKW